MGRPVTSLGVGRPPSEIHSALKASDDTYRGPKERANAHFIPALAKVDSSLYGALVTTDGKAYTSSPGKLGIAVISPPLDKAGNSVRAQKAIADISNAIHGHPCT